jgi:hypothetical protein
VLLHFKPSRCRPNILLFVIRYGRVHHIVHRPCILSSRNRPAPFPPRGLTFRSAVTRLCSSALPMMTSSDHSRCSFFCRFQMAVAAACERTIAMMRILCCGFGCTPRHLDLQDISALCNRLPNILHAASKCEMRQLTTLPLAQIRTQHAYLRLSVIGANQGTTGILLRQRPVDDTCRYCEINHRAQSSKPREQHHGIGGI